MRKLLTVIALTLCLAIQAMDALPTRVLVIMAEFSDAKFADDNDKTAYSDFFNGTNYTYNGATGSVQRYFNDQSFGKSCKKSVSAFGKCIECLFFAKVKIV